MPPSRLVGPIRVAIDLTTGVKRWTALVRLRAAKDNVHEFACHEGNVDVIRGILGGARAEEAAQR